MVVLNKIYTRTGDQGATRLATGEPYIVFIDQVNRMMPKKPEAPAAPAGPSDNDLLKEILAELKKK